MTPQAEQWAPLVSLRPGSSSDILILSNPLERRRFRVNRRALMKLLVSSSTAKPPSAAATALAVELASLGWRPGAKLAQDRSLGLKSWWTMGWHPSLEYYLWSRERNFIDLADDDGAIRRSRVRELLNGEGPPPPRVAVDASGVSLPEPRKLPPTGLGELLTKRKTIRVFSRTASVGADKLSSVLKLGLADIAARRRVDLADPLNYLQSHGVAFDFYVVVYAVDGIDAGAYLYDIASNALIPVRLGAHRDEMVRVLFGMRAPQTAAWTIVFAADFAQYQWRYRHERALRHIYMACGRHAQRLLIIGECLGLGTLPTPATSDRILECLLRFDTPRQAPVYSLTMGVPPRGRGQPH
jgi:SagB-type dehydrogenase family enzyme